MEGDEPVLMATTPLSGMVNGMSLVQAGLLAATMRLTCGGGGRFGLMAGTHGGDGGVVLGVPHCGGARAGEILVVPFPARAKGAYTVLPSGLTAKARGLSPNTGMVSVRASVVVLNTSI